MIPFTRPIVSSNETTYLESVCRSQRPWGGGEFYGQASNELSAQMGGKEVLLTQSCTSALELAALAIDIEPGDEVIVPSYTFVSSANAFALRGAKIVFADSEPSTMNLDVANLEALISPKTRAIVAVHYGGVACDMDELTGLSAKHNLVLIEDAAQAIGASYKGKPLGSLGDFGCISFHGTKNISSGEGGALVLGGANRTFHERARLAHEKGTDRSAFLRGEVDKYTWRTLGSSFIPSEFTAAVLSAQLEKVDEVTQRRRGYWQDYDRNLRERLPENYSALAQGGEGSNGHMYALLVPTEQARRELMSALKEAGVAATSHYEPLHSSPFGSSIEAHSDNHFPIVDEFSSRLLRVPMWSADGLPVEEISEKILTSIARIS